EELWKEDRKSKDATIDSLKHQISHLEEELQKVEHESEQKIDFLNKENEINIKSELERLTVEQQKEIENQKLEFEKSLQDLKISYECKEKLWEQEATALREGINITQMKLDESIQ